MRPSPSPTLISQNYTSEWQNVCSPTSRTLRSSLSLRPHPVHGPHQSRLGRRRPGATGPPSATLYNAELRHGPSHTFFASFTRQDQAPPLTLAAVATPAQCLLVGRRASGGQCRCAGGGRRRPTQPGLPEQGDAVAQRRYWFGDDFSCGGGLRGDRCQHEPAA